MVLEIVLLLAGLGIILAAAEFFTNGIEHLGEKLNLGEAAVGSVLAAVGTAMPETLIPIVAILFGGAVSGHAVGVGAILGAPFMLSTLAFAVTSLAAFAYSRRRATGKRLSVDRSNIRRDLRYFLPMYGAAVCTTWLPQGPIRLLVCAVLLASYVRYVWLTLKSGGTLPENKKPLRFQIVWLHLALTRLPEETRQAFLHRVHATASNGPHLGLTLGQVIASLLVMLVGARLFVGSVEQVSVMLGVSSLLVALIVAPIATELPEKFNSVLWVRQSKDTLALGNITGAMVFQSSVPVALGIALTEWKLHDPTVHGHAALFSAFIALTSAAIVFLCARHRHTSDQTAQRTSLSPWVLLVGLPLYLVFITAIAFKW